MHRNRMFSAILLRLWYLLYYISDIETSFWPTHSLTEKFSNTYRDRIEIQRNLQRSFWSAKSRDAFMLKIFKMK